MTDVTFLIVHPSMYTKDSFTTETLPTETFAVEYETLLYMGKLLLERQRDFKEDSTMGIGLVVTILLLGSLLGLCARQSARNEEEVEISGTEAPPTQSQVI